ncbi:protein disulfide isomerase pTAC5, chloroplastic [Hordeum vulgare subsp. vulgare]|uniref:Peptidoglycan binding-like domain-containing protein n=1 Tax=Hordeum vulgare subsp. vulgare TaxID=112509 RepID=A0A8I6WQR5_HORVV|nr:protein disulfide isomerase pTAC5, chloroplastic [Hordeum vulgare subsp. vulgare]
MIITTPAFPSVSSFHRPRLRPYPRRAVLLLVRSAASSSSSSSSEEREEARWLREEQRWLREEQRWLREESRWRAEREALLAEITALRLRLRALEPLPLPPAAPLPPPAPAATRAAPPPPPPPPAPSARVAPPPPAPAASVAPPPPPAPAPVEEVEVRKEVVVVEEKAKAKAKPKAGAGSGKKRALRVGSEGEEVRAMQEALEKLGFYSGEEDTEFSSFSTGTERAVKTWQASIGTTEDGLMTSELLEMLFTGRTQEDLRKEGVNGALVPPVAETAELQQPVVEKIDYNKHRVYLLGENRWEDPSRLTKKDKPIIGSTVSSTKQCITCRGEGRLLCLECDGTGEPNIEPQFLEWVGEDTKCPYCEGLGYTICDVCQGIKTVHS